MSYPYWDFEPVSSETKEVYVDTRDLLQELCKRVVEAEEEIIKAWFQMAFKAARDYEDMSFEVWWDNFYKTLQQGAEGANGG